MCRRNWVEESILIYAETYDAETYDAETKMSEMGKNSMKDYYRKIISNNVEPFELF